MKAPFWHRPLKAYVKLCLSLYFRKWQIQGLENVPYNRPVIFVSNHQNAFLDALLILSPLKRMPWFLARGDVFKMNWLKKILSSVHIMPIYRFRDGFNALKNNEIIFSKSAELLLQNQSVLMFGEGNHGEEWRLRPLQKGFARIAFATEITTNWKANLCIVPVGIQYEAREEMRSRVLLSFGNAINVAEFKSSYQAHPNEGINALISETSTAMKKLILHIEPEEHYQDIVQQLMQERTVHKDLAKQLEADRQLAEKLKMEGIAGQQNEVFKKSTPFWKWFNPILIYGLFNNLITHGIQRLVINYVTDPQFKPSLYFLVALIFMPISMIIQATIFYMIVEDALFTVVYAISIPLSGIWGYQFYKQ